MNIIYLTQAIYGIGTAMAYPAWFTLFTMHLDRKHRGYEWSLWSTGVGMATALTAYLGAVIAQNLGFKNLFFIVSFVSLLGLITLFFLSKKYLRDVEKIENIVLLKHHKKL